ncbi:MAG: class I SAM-dependent DNA methyltransferase [Promethearchaeota archaeon]
MRSADAIAPPYFLNFLGFIYPLVANHILNNLNQDSPYKEKIYAILNEISWNEWKNRPTAFVNSLSKILVTLFYDKILFITQCREYSSSFEIFLRKFNSLSSEVSKREINSKKATNQFLKLIDNLWDLNLKFEPPIMSSKFPFNELLTLLFPSWDCCIKSIELIQEIKEDTRGKNQLLLPYIFEIGIPDKQKQFQGQVFTPLQVINFICKQNITDKTTRVIDPACGTGAFLLGALRELYESKTILSNRVELIGIEKDPILTDIAQSAIHYFLFTNSISLVDWKIICDDFFNCNVDSLGHFRKNTGTTTILMNPPYTRHEQLSSDYKKFVKDRIEFDLQEMIQQTMKKSISGRSGIYVYFLIHATRLLEEGDNMGLIIPNSWMDVDYGESFQTFILDNYIIESIITSRLEKLIPNVDVNTAILKLIRKTIKATNEYNLVNFISIDDKTDLEQLNQNDLFQLKNSSRIQVISIRHENLYFKSKWGVFHRAPKDYFELLNSIEDKFVNLSEVANIRRGFTSGANDFFYVAKPGETNSFFRSDWNSKTGQLLLFLKDESITKRFEAQGFIISEPMFFIERDYWMHQIPSNINETFTWRYSYKDNDGSIWIPNYLIKTPRDLKTYKIHEDDLKYIVILIPNQSSGEELKLGVKDYIRWGESWKPTIGEKFNHRPTCSSRKNWYSLPSNEYKSFNLLCLMTINDRFPFFYNPHDFYFDARLYGIRFIKKNGYLPYYFLLLNSFLTALQIELLGRSNLGEGGLDIKVYEYELVKVPSYEFLSKADFQDVIHAFVHLLDHAPYSIIQGKPKQPRQMTEEFLKRLFNIPQKLIDSLFNELNKLVKMRIEKAKD